VIRSQLSAKSRPNLYAWHTHKPNINDLEVRTLIMYRYIVHIAELLLLEILNIYFIFPNVILPVFPRSIFLIWFRTGIIGNISTVVAFVVENNYTSPFSKWNLKQLELSQTQSRWRAIHKENSNKMQKCIKILLFHIYMKPMVVGPCHHGMARPQVADGRTASYMEGSCE
jgi:hypothetical protein